MCYKGWPAMKITVCVMAHPKRKVHAEALAKQLMTMPFDDISISYDSPNAGSHGSEWDNGKLSLEMGIGKGDWHAIIQDDAILCPMFYDNLVGAVSNVPIRSLISLYTGKTRPYPKRVSLAVEKARYASWLQYWLLLWGVGIVIPSDHIQPLLDFVSDRDEPYDTRIGIFYQRNRLPVYYTMPSLVDHNDSLGSLLPGHGTLSGDRVAHKLATKIIKFNNKVVPI